MAKNQNNNVAPATKKTGAEAKKDALATALAQIEKLRIKRPVGPRQRAEQPRADQFKQLHPKVPFFR